MGERVICLIDGEHQPAVVKDALDQVSARHEIAAVLFCGGEEKVPLGALDDPEPHYGRPVVLAENGLPSALADLATGAGASAVLDLADEPVLDAPAKLLLASVAVHNGLSFRGPGFEISPQAYMRPPLTCPTVAVIGTGKRCGKTAVAAHWARLLSAAGRRPVVVSMGRGGPREPEVARAGTGLEELLRLARDGRHAASDYLEDAVLAGVDTVGCRRAGGGLAGQVADTNLAAGLELAAGLDPGVAIFEGSGATIPAVEVERTVCVTADRQQSLGDMGPLRLLRADLVLQAADDSDLQRDIEKLTGTTVIRCTLRAEPAEQLPPDARVAFFSTSPSAELYPQPLLSSPNLARRAALGEDLDRAEQEGCDTYVTEIKAAAIDTVAERAERSGARLVFCRNTPVPLDGEPDLDEALMGLVP